MTADSLPPSAALSRKLENAFARGAGHGLLELGAGEVGTVLPADFSYWRDFAAQLVTTICTHPDLDVHAPIPAPALGVLEVLVAAAPPMTGAEYMTASVQHAGKRVRSTASMRRGSPTDEIRK